MLKFKIQTEKSVLKQPSAFHKILTTIIFGMTFLLTRQCVLNLDFKYISFSRWLEFRIWGKSYFCNLENNLNITEKKMFSWNLLKWIALLKFAFSIWKLQNYRVILPLF